MAEQDGALRMDLHLCNTYRHLLMSLATIAAAARPALVIYLEDEVAIPAPLRARLAAACPQASFLFTRDADQIAAFAFWPAALPALLRRNLGGRLGLQRPANWQPPLLAGRRFATGYLYHSGFFLSKAVASLCQRVVLRESGLNNYTTLHVPPLKALLRLCTGLPARQQIWGEEPWIDQLEMSHPEQLPAKLRSKAQRLTFGDVMDALPAASAHRIAAAFLTEFPSLAPEGKTALLLTQPLGMAGLCSPAEKQALYADLAARLVAAGYQLYVKPHPLEQSEPALLLPGARLLPAAFPVEAWPYLAAQKFDIAVALYSAALLAGGRDFAHLRLQLLPAEAFNAAGTPRWKGLIDAAWPHP
jgi:hypothetical protein